MLLNLDAGEHADEPAELWRLADVVCIACGGHAGDTASMRRVIAEARGIGAHPSYPDREGFGRRTIAMALPAVTATIAEQCGQLAALASVEYVKPHGALYHDANAKLDLAVAMIDGAVRALGPAVIVIGPPRGRLREAAEAAGLRYLREGFADRAVRADGSLVPRTEPGALVTDPAIAAARVRELVADHDTVCIHADTQGALAIARAVRAAVDGLSRGA